MTITRWNGQHCFVLAQEAIRYIDNLGELQALTANHHVIDVDNAQFTAELNARGIHWAAVDAVLNGQAYGAGRRYWSRTTAEGEAIRGKQDTAAKTLADVLATAKSIKSA